jgi:hypothetical protein
LQSDPSFEPPIDCVGVAVCVVVLPFDAVESAVFVSVCVADDDGAGGSLDTMS